MLTQQNGPAAAATAAAESASTGGIGSGSSSCTGISKTSTVSGGSSSSSGSSSNLRSGNHNHNQQHSSSSISTTTGAAATAEMALAINKKNNGKEVTTTSNMTNGITGVEGSSGSQSGASAAISSVNSTAAASASTSGGSTGGGNNGNGSQSQSLASASAAGSSSGSSSGQQSYSKRNQQQYNNGNGSHTQRRYNGYSNGYGGHRNNFGNNRRQFHHNNDYYNGHHHHHNNHHHENHQQYSNGGSSSSSGSSNGHYEGGGGYYNNGNRNNANNGRNYNNPLNNTRGGGYGSHHHNNHHHRNNNKGAGHNNNGYVPEFEDGLPCPPPPKRSWNNSNLGSSHGSAGDAAATYAASSYGGSSNKGFFSLSPVNQLSPDAGSPTGESAGGGGGGSFVITAHSMGTCYEYLYGGNVITQCGTPNGAYHHYATGYTSAHHAYNFAYQPVPIAAANTTTAVESGTNNVQDSPCSETNPTVGLLETSNVTNESIVGSEKNAGDWQDEIISDGNASDDDGSVSTSVSTNKSACEDDDIPELTTDTGIRYLPMITPEVNMLAKEVTPHKGTLYLRHSARYGFGIHNYYHPNPNPEFYRDIDTEIYIKQFSRAGEVTETPSKLCPGYSTDTLSKSIWAKFFENQQSTETFKKKIELWRDVYKAVRYLNISQAYKHDARNFPHFGLQVVGSTMSGFGSNTSDVDMCLLIRSSEVDQRFEAVERLQALWQNLKNLPGIENQELIYAKVPILKFRDEIRGLEVDLNCNNFVGIRNTHLLYAYAQMDWRLKPLVLAVKLWAQHHKINDAKNMTISSYSLVLMVIHFLQYGVSEPVLPCLHQMYPDKFSNTVPILNVKIHELMPFWESKNKSNLGELLIGFLEYYAKKFDFSKYAVSVRLGGLLQIKQASLHRSPKNDPHQWKFLCVEEPFDRTNTARSVYDRDVFEKILGIFAASWKSLERTKDLSSIFDTFGPSEARNISPYVIKSR